MEVKRFWRKKNEYEQRREEQTRENTNPQKKQTGSSESTEGQSSSLLIGGITFRRSPSISQKPWEEKKLGWIPTPTTERARFMNAVLPKCYKAFYANCKNAREFVKLFHHEGRRQYDSQQNIFKFESRLKSIMSSSNPAAAGKFYDDNYVLVKSDQIIIRSNIKTMVDLQKNIQQEHMGTNEHLNSLFAKNGNLKQGQDCAKSFDEQMITQLIEQEERVKNTLEFLKKKEDMCADMFKDMLLKKKSVKRSQKQNRRKNKKRKEQRSEKKFKEITELISADISQPVITDVNVEGVVSRA